MITESARIQGEEEQREERKQFLKQVIDSSGRYERLLVNKDFQDLLKDLRGVMGIHDREITRLVADMLASDSPFKRFRLESVLMKHQSRKEQLAEAVGYPDRLLHEARQAREEMSKIHEEEKHYVRPDGE